MNHSFKFFFGVEKNNYDHKTMKKIKVKNITSSKPNNIQEEQSFFKDRYKKKTPMRWGYISVFFLLLNSTNIKKLTKREISCEYVKSKRWTQKDMTNI